jgi:HEPN domain-containing protein
MQPLDPEGEWLISEWIRKADVDLSAAHRLRSEDGLREIVTFHCQQAAEKYLKALLTRFRVDFPKTHDIEKLLYLAAPLNRAVIETLFPARWLGPFAVEVRYPGDSPDLLPGDEAKAIALAVQVKEAVLALLASASTPVFPPSQIDRSKLNDLK